LLSTTFALETPSYEIERGMSLDLAFSSTSREAIILSTVMVSLLCFKLVEKYFQDGGSLAIMPPTMNLFHDRSIINYLVFMVLVINIKFTSSIRFHILAIQGIP
jgi:hypothetical protein